MDDGSVDGGSAGARRTELRHLVRPHRSSLALLATVSTVAGFLQAATLILVVQAAITLSGGEDTVAVEAGPLSWDGSVAGVLAAAAACILAAIVLHAVASHLTARIGARAAADARRSLLVGYLRAEWSTQVATKEGELQELTSVAGQNVAKSMLDVAAVVGAAAAFVAMALSALFVDAIATALILAGVAVLIVALVPLTRLNRSLSRRHADAQGDLAGAVAETARIAREIRTTDTIEATERRLGAHIATTAARFETSHFVARLAPPLFQNVALLGIVACLLAIRGLDADRVTTLSATIVLMLRALSYAQMFQGSLQQLVTNLPYVERLDAATSRFEAAAFARDGEDVDHVACLELAGVSFRYPMGEEVLHDVSLTIARGESVGLIGPSGAGKSTLVDVLLRLRTPTVGTYLVNGEPASGLSWTSWCALVSYLPQDGQLYMASVVDNIRFFRPELTDRDIETAARLAGIHDDIEAWRGGYDTLIGPRGLSVSGGQRQRICLARALAGRPDVLILDEPTSALDQVNERLVVDTLRDLAGTVTMVIVSHRPSTLAACDRVLEVSAGAIAERAR